MGWLECVEFRSYIAGEDLRFDFRAINGLDDESKEFDINCDGITTISDIWEFIKFVVRMPGDFIMSSVLGPKGLQFFEISSPYGTHASTAIGWMIVMSCIVAVFDR